MEEYGIGNARRTRKKAKETVNILEGEPHRWYHFGTKEESGMIILKWLLVIYIGLIWQDLTGKFQGPWLKICNTVQFLRDESRELINYLVGYYMSYIKCQSDLISIIKLI